MGCPDWPKCFGTWVPPTSEDQLPDNYEKEYLSKREKKVSRLADMLNNMGFTNKAEEIRAAGSQLESEAFNVRKTYTEYVNRLWGAITGFFTLLAGISSLQFFRSRRSVTVYTLLGLLFVVFNGWLGSVVVDTNLLGGVVSTHFVLAFLAITFFMIAFYTGKNTEGGTSNRVSLLVVVGLILSVFQLLSGTSVREEIDILAKGGTAIGIENFTLLGGVFNMHRILALTSAILVALIWYTNRQDTNRPKTSLIALATLGILIVQAITGILNIRMGFPAMAQLLHVVLGSLTLVSFIYLTIHEFKSRKLQYVN